MGPNIGNIYSKAKKCQNAKIVLIFHVQVKEESSAYFFWAIYITLVLLAIGNLVTTLIVVHVLR